MRRTLTITALSVLVGGAADAQGLTGSGEHPANFTATATLASGAASGQFGLRAATHVMLFGETGHLRTLETPTTRAGLDQRYAAISADLPSARRVQTAYSLAGIKVDIPGHTLFTPYVFTGIGAARLAPPSQFTYEGGPTLEEGVAGSPTTTVLIVRVGGGVQIPVGTHLVGEIGYAVSRVSSTQVVEAHGLTMGLSVKF